MTSARLAIAGAALFVAFMAGWMINGWRVEAHYDRQRAADTQNAADLLKAATDARDALAMRLQESDDRAAKQLKDQQDENLRLRDRVASGSVGLRVAARCPAFVQLPEAAASAGVDPRAGAELDAGARPDYFALRDGLARFESKLSACQSQLRGRSQ